MHTSSPAVLALQLRDTASALVDELVDATAKPEVAKVSVIDTLSALTDSTTATRGGKPLALVNYNGKKLGVFWKGEGKNNAGPSVGLRKLVKSGKLHRGHRKWAPAYWVTINELADHGN